jgi:hypothetical protein
MDPVIAVRIPRWAERAGMPKPRDAETFETYWARMGVSHEVVTMALANLDPRAEDVANDRMACYVRNACPRAFEQAALAMSPTRPRRAL